LQVDRISIIRSNDSAGIARGKPSQVDSFGAPPYFGALTREKMATRTIEVNREAMTFTELKSER
jgi:hypothetical protein